MTQEPFVLATTRPVCGPAGSAERALMLATLADSIRTILGARSGRLHVARRREEIAWVSSGDSSRPFAFENICDALGIDPDHLRRRVLRAAGDGGAR